MSLRRLRMGLNTVLGLKKEGFFIPYRYAASLPDAEARQPYRAIETFMAAREADFAKRLDNLAAYRDIFEGFGTLPPPEPRFEQDWFPRLDAAISYAMVRQEKPARIVEVGSGHSTRFMARAIKDGNLSTEFTAIDPAPRAAIESLPIQVIHKTLHEVEKAPFTKLAAGDILFIDSSHIAMPGSDVDHLFLDILPSLPPGVFIHIHDIFLPDDYPASWDWRGYNEQQITAPLFLGGGFELIFSSAYVATRMKKMLAQSTVGGLPLPQGAFETSLWIRK
ncbi:class I SAM-dependent methyltransferase [Sneathiella litorea]|uniref:Class I SAM-dependent methyltransferase n=1 Tax=Sneathiella litorea TaxID=2606216 RepID=A0A6L8W585_9PROT|nr:class I SAM-dependent methyltransferase [Sneathiella litorea]MZR29889.1 class I SAM-dependent methyltransferase [Sneathiella litorea]